jgi:hypothetical protein
MRVLPAVVFPAHEPVLAVLFFPDRFHKFFSCHGGSSFPMW